MSMKYLKSQTNYKGYETCAPGQPNIRMSKTKVKDVTNTCGSENSGRDVRNIPVDKTPSQTRD